MSVFLAILTFPGSVAFLPGVKSAGWVFSHLTLRITVGLSCWAGGLGTVTLSSFSKAEGLTSCHQRGLKDQIDGRPL